LKFKYFTINKFVGYHIIEGLYTHI